MTLQATHEELAEILSDLLPGQPVPDLYALAEAYNGDCSEGRIAPIDLRFDDPPLVRWKAEILTRHLRPTGMAEADPESRLQRDPISAPVSGWHAQDLITHMQQRHILFRRGSRMPKPTSDRGRG